MANHTEFNQQQLAAALTGAADAKRWWVAFSGGLDSTVLLHALTTWRRETQWPGPKLLAIHVNHGLAADADHWQRHCEQYCRRWDVELIVERVAVETQGEGVEAAARRARYQAIAKHAGAGDLVLTAHHRDDQAETLLLRLLRGSGLRGLAAMARQRPLGPAKIARPLLEFSRRQLAAYAGHHGLDYREDDSNRETLFDRNFLRHEVFPLLQNRWPNLSRRWARTAQVLAESEQALAELAELDLAACAAESARLGWRLRFDTFAELSPPRRNNIIRHWCEQCGLPLPEYRHLQTLADQLNRDADTAIAGQWPGVCLRGFQQYLYLLPAAALQSDSGAWPVVQTLPADAKLVELPDGGELAVASAPGGLRTDLGPLSIRWRQGGERCQPQFRQRSQTLKKCLQEIALEPWLRDRVPLIYAGDTLVAVADLWTCAGMAAPADQHGLQFRWFYPAKVE